MGAVFKRVRFSTGSWTIGCLVLGASLGGGAGFTIEGSTLGSGCWCTGDVCALGGGRGGAGGRCSCRYSMVFPVSASNTGIAISWIGVHHRANRACG